MHARPTRDGKQQHGPAEWPPRSSTTRHGLPQAAGSNNTTNGLKMRRYIGLDILAKSRMTLIETAESEEVTLTAITA